mgnify:CR=1 FL=1
MTTTELYKMAKKDGIDVFFFNLPEASSISAQINGKCYIALNSSIAAHPKEERTKLAHEMGHCETGSFYNVYSPLDVRAKHERAAKNWSIKKLIQKDELIQVIKGGLDNAYLLAEHFDVTEDFMIEALEYYDLYFRPCE